MSKEQDARPIEETEVQTVNADGVLTAISRADLDNQITTAKAYPRSVRKFQDACHGLATLNEQVASQCFYVLPARKGGSGEPIQGPSARFAELVMHSWKNCRAGATVVEEGAEFITARGVFRDLESNTEVTFDVRRRITTKSGQRFGADMIGVTGNAACAIAMRNAVLKGVPKALWEPIYEAARKAAVGDEQTLASKRAEMIAYLGKRGVTKDMVLGMLGVAALEDIGLDHVATIKGVLTAVKDGDTTLEAAFKPQAPAAAPGAAAGQKGMDGLAARMDGKP